jgi:RNA polymerase sigma factor (sigma-70 family)
MKILRQSGAGDDGDGQDFEAAFDRLSQLAFRISFPLLQNRQDCEDVAIEVLARAAVRWKSIKGNPDPWIAKVTINRSLDVLRQRKAASRPHPVSTLNTEDTNHDERLDLVSALQRLPMRQRETIALRYFAGLSEEEVARAFGCSVGTVKQHSSRAIRKLRNLISTKEA